MKVTPEPLVREPRYRKDSEEVDEESPETYPVETRLRYPTERRERVLRRHPNDDDNPLVPELDGPPSKGKKVVDDEDEEETDDKEHQLTRKETEDFDRIVKEAKEAKTKADKEKKDGKDKKALSQSTHQFHSVHQAGRKHHKNHHNRDYLQLKQDTHTTSNQTDPMADLRRKLRVTSVNSTTNNTDKPLNANTTVKPVIVRSPKATPRDKAIKANQTQHKNTSNVHQRNASSKAPHSTPAVMRSANSSGAIDLVQKANAKNSSLQSNQTRPLASATVVSNAK